MDECWFDNFMRRYFSWLDSIIIKSNHVNEFLISSWHRNFCMTVEINDFVWIDQDLIGDFSMG